MSSYMADLGTYINSANSANATEAKNEGIKKAKKNAMGLDMTDFLQLMVAQFQNQSIDNTADTSDMLNQLVQMQMVQALTSMTDASIMSYASSLVGKEVTVGTYDAKGKLQETVGIVTGTGTFNEQQVVFVDGEMYYMSDIMAVGRLPEAGEAEKPDNNGAENGNSENSGSGDVEAAE